jgi:hypothetical protein
MIIFNYKNIVLYTISLKKVLSINIYLHTPHQKYTSSFMVKSKHLLNLQSNMLYKERWCLLSHLKILLSGI